MIYIVYFGINFSFKMRLKFIFYRIYFFKIIKSILNKIKIK